MHNIPRTLPEHQSTHVASSTAYLVQNSLYSHATIIKVFRQRPYSVEITISRHLAILDFCIFIL